MENVLSKPIGSLCAIVLITLLCAMLAQCVSPIPDNAIVSITVPARLSATTTIIAPEVVATEAPEGSSPTAKPTASIIEITPFGGYVATPSSGYAIADIKGQYRPFNRQYVRVCPAVGPSCIVRYTLTGNATVEVFAQLIVYPQGDVWLCLDKPPALYVSSMCNLVVAYSINNRVYGSLVLD